MYSIKTWFSLVLCLVGIYIFICFEDFIVVDKDYIDGAVTTKNRMTRSIIYAIAQNKYGFWVVRCIPLIVGLGFGKNFINEIKAKKK